MCSLMPEVRTFSPNRQFAGEESRVRAADPWRLWPSTPVMGSYRFIRERQCRGKDQIVAFRDELGGFSQRMMVSKAASGAGTVTAELKDRPLSFIRDTVAAVNAGFL